VGSTPSVGTTSVGNLQTHGLQRFSGTNASNQLLQRSLARGRLGHAYLFSGDQLEELELLARTLAKTLNCQNPVKINGPDDCCDECLSCRKIETTPTPTSIGRGRNPNRAIITVEQMRD
jgi:DNA polymerase III subunit delta'